MIRFRKSSPGIAPFFDVRKNEGMKKGPFNLYYEKIK